MNHKQENKELKNKLITANKKLKEFQKENEKLKWDCEQMGQSPWMGTPACDKMLKLKKENDELKKEQEELKETYFQKGFDAGKEEYEVDKEFLNEKDEEIKELKEQIAKLERWSRAKTEVNMFLSLQWKELITSQDLSQMSGLGKDLGTDIAIVDIAEKFVKHEQENKKLQEKFDEKEHWGLAVRDYMDYGDHWCDFDEWLRENINEDDKKHEWVKIWMENIGYEEEEEEEEDCKK